jgi:hypothetical protein
MAPKRINIIDIVLAVTFTILVLSILMRELWVWEAHRKDISRISLNLFGHFKGDFGTGVASRYIIIAISSPSNKEEK